MKTSASRILTTHVGSIPRPERLTELLRARLGGEVIDEGQLDAYTDEAVADVVRQQAGNGSRRHLRRRDGQGQLPGLCR